MGEVIEIFLFLVVVLILGNLWFHFIEAILGWIKKIFLSHRKSSAWHALPSEKEEKS